MASTNDQIYRPLRKNECRLAHLAPGSYNDPIHCDLHHFELTNFPQYEALSYVWGDPNNTAPIVVQGHTLQVTTNLEVALRHLRYSNKVRVLWIDAIVINQIDLDERTEQVALMGDIYSKAASVRIWLGPADDDSDLFIQYFRNQNFGWMSSFQKAWKARSLIVETRRWSPKEKRKRQSYLHSRHLNSVRQVVILAAKPLYHEYLSEFMIRLGVRCLIERFWFSR